MAKQYNRVMLGASSMYAERCYKEGFIGASFEITEDLTGKFEKTWWEFNQKYIPIYQKAMPEKSNTAAGLACGFLRTICVGLEIGDVVLSPNGKGQYFVGEISSPYYYVPNDEIPHRRKVNWLDKVIPRDQMPDQLRRSTGSIGTCCDITKYADEIEALIKTASPIAIKQTSAKPSVTTSFKERDLHKLLCYYVRKHEQILAKTIFHEKSKHVDKNNNWLHPDIVGARFTSLQNDHTKALLKNMASAEAVTLYSYELKRSIDCDSDLKQYFFQAVSNSSWANYGYLVAFQINDNVMEELQRLSVAFGIGVILLQPHPEYCKELFPATKHELDFNAIDRLCESNPDFEEYIHDIAAVLDAPNGYMELSKKKFEKSCDELFSQESEIDTYCQQKNIPY